MIFIPDYVNTQGMWEKALKNDPYNLKLVADHFKTQKMCNKTVKDEPSSLQYIPDWFVTRDQIQIWDDDDNFCDDDEIIEWCNGYKKRKAQKASIKEEYCLASIRYCDWCVPQDEKQETEKLWT